MRSQLLTQTISQGLSLAIYAAALVLIIVSALLAARDPARRGAALLQAGGAGILLLSIPLFRFLLIPIAARLGRDDLMGMYSVSAMASSLGWILFAGGYFLERRVRGFPPPPG